MFELRGVSKHYGGVVAVDDVTMRIPPGERHCIVGPNGAGKSTLLGLMTGDTRLSDGEIWLEDERTDGLEPHQLAALGVMRKFQVPAVFPELTVRDNLAVAATGCLPIRRLLRAAGPQEASIGQVLERTRLTAVADVPAGELSHGKIQWLEIGMTIVSEPRVLLLDEPTAGMTRAETLDTAALLLDIAARTSATMIVVEHDMEFVRGIADRVTVLHKGAVLTQGSIDEVENDPQVRQVYLGIEMEGPDDAA